MFSPNAREEVSVGERVVCYIVRRGEGVVSRLNACPFELYLREVSTLNSNFSHVRTFFQHNICC